MYRSKTSIYKATVYTLIYLSHKAFGIRLLLSPIYHKHLLHSRSRTMGTKHTTDEHSAAASLATNGGKLLFCFLHIK